MGIGLGQPADAPLRTGTIGLTGVCVIVWALGGPGGSTARAQDQGPELSPDSARDVELIENDPSPPLEGAAWQLEQYRTAAGLKAALSDAGACYAVFDDGHFRINGGCNTLNGSYWLNGSRLMFSPHVASVLAECPATLLEQEQTVLELLNSVQRITPLGNRLALLDGSGETLMTLMRPSAIPLQGPVWQLTAYRNRAGAIVAALPEPKFNLEFIDGGNLLGRACDTYRAVYTRDEQRLRLVGPVATTRLICPESEAASQQGNDYLSALEQVRGYRVDQHKLLLRDTDGRMLARFEQTEPGNPRPEAVPLDNERARDNLPPAPRLLLPARP